MDAFTIYEKEMEINYCEADMLYHQCQYQPIFIESFGVKSPPPPKNLY